LRPQKPKISDVPKTSTAKVSSMTAPQKGCPFCDGGPQGLRRPRFSFFRFTCQTARQPCGSLSSTGQSLAKSRRSRTPDDFSEVCPHKSEELQARHRADSGRRAVWPGLYERHPTVSTTKNLNFAPAKLFAIAAFKRTLTKLPQCETNRLRRTRATFLRRSVPDGTEGEPFQASLPIRAVTGPSLTGA
jgi:hypothetical protein